MNDEIERLKQKTRDSMHEALASMHLQVVALVKEGRGDHAPAQVLRQRIRELEDLQRKS